ncbi:MAG: hypothetical protein AVDCRST_MAG69-1203 [uncultured Solirubrobacteraceae bacterium]|uniref:Uncharacterized protein n=1 Tax=uncultured Solirubrobacteraceae bacterium TaxID=1162706 RepID=A0A6J4SD28_9ACTN|nr:MAG: hypothetical protein AVDCRST_MAG69-1203 [uncultured Solirubrobacteraceae bacterium]
MTADGCLERVSCIQREFPIGRVTLRAPGMSAPFPRGWPPPGTGPYVSPATPGARHAEA